MNKSLEDEVAQRFGVLPNFFRLASSDPEITKNLWGFAQFAYLDNPLPSLFKERLFVYLSRFCEVRYCIARHLGFLVGLGYPAGDPAALTEKVEAVLPLLRRPLPHGDGLMPFLAVCAEFDSPLSSFPAPESSGEQALFACATHLFLQTPDSSRAQEALGRALGPGNLERLKLFLAFVRTAHYWTKLHPELAFEDDVIQLLSTHETVAQCILKDPEAQMDGLGRHMAAELASLRTLHKQHEIISQAYGQLRVDHQYLTQSLHKTEENLRELTLAMRAQEEMLARQKLESMGTLARGIAHDFNNLLGGILATTELALGEGARGSIPEEELLTIRTTAIRGGELVRQLMAYSGEESLAFEPIDLSSLVDEMMQLLKASVSKQAILQTDLGAGLSAVNGNPSQIRQVVMNLVINASEAIGGRAGVIRVTTAKVRIGSDASVTDAVNLPPGDYLKLEVADTGRGMTPEVQTRIFDPFFTTKLAGHGLGLAAVQGIVRGHGGAINVVSSLGQGTRFEVLLPCTNQQVKLIPDIVAQTSAGKVAKVIGTVLVVEDEDTLRLAVSKMLRKKGLTVIEADDGSAAVDLFRANELDIAVVLLDVTLPGMSGPEVLAELGRIRPDIKVIVTTAYGRETTLPICGGQQSWTFIRKPYQLNAIWSLILGGLSQNGMSAASDLPAS